MQEILNMNIYLGLVSEIDSNIQEIYNTSYIVLKLKAYHASSWK